MRATYTIDSTPMKANTDGVCYRLVKVTVSYPATCGAISTFGELFGEHPIRRAFEMIANVCPPCEGEKT